MVKRMREAGVRSRSFKVVTLAHEQLRRKSKAQASAGPEKKGTENGISWLLSRVDEATEQDRDHNFLPLVIPLPLWCWKMHEQ
jgi:hypothetical protein